MSITSTDICCQKLIVCFSGKRLSSIVLTSPIVDHWRSYNLEREFHKKCYLFHSLSIRSLVLILPEVLRFTFLMYFFHMYVKSSFYSLEYASYFKKNSCTFLHNLTFMKWYNFMAMQVINCTILWTLYECHDTHLYLWYRFWPSGFHASA